MATITTQKITEKLQEKFGNNILSVEEPYHFLTFTVQREILPDLLHYLYHDQELAFTFLTDITGIHLPEPEDRLGVIYHLHNFPENVRIRLKSFFPKSDPWIASATFLFSGANWMERETYDFFGIEFKGHPNLRRILNVDDLDYFPLRKEYALEDSTRTDKDDTMFGRE